LTIITKSSVSAPTNLILAHPFSKITIIEETRVVGPSSHAFIPETYIVAHPSSQVEHIALDQENDQGLHHGSIFIDVAKDAIVRTFFFTTSGRMIRKNLSLNLNAPGARGETYSLFLTSKSEHSDIYTVINHKSPDTSSDQMAKGILDGESRGIFTGKIHIHPKAQRVISGQLNKNLLLSKKTQIHSQPQLEIFADDVKCSHGSTTGQLSDDEIFYFQARGIPAEGARNLLALGFGLEIVQKIQDKQAREHVMKIIRDMLVQKFSLRKSV
jgi:Fe-S cluster assembly protein SufD